MSTIDAQIVKTLRDRTNAGMMDCKRALAEAKGDLEQAEKILRTKLNLSAAKKSGRDTKEGLVVAQVHEDGQSGVLIELDCETDFVARNENFQQFVQKLARSALAIDEAQFTQGGDFTRVDTLLCAPFGDSTTTCADAIKEKIGELGENMVLRRVARFTLANHGLIGSYIHLGGKVGVLLEVTSSKPDAAKNPAFRELVKDLTLHIAAASPQVITRDQVPAEQIEAEREIAAAQVKNKPAQVIEKIVSGKIDKYLAGICLLEQPFVKDSNLTIQQLIQAKAKELNDTISPSRFARFAVGE